VRGRCATGYPPFCCVVGAPQAGPCWSGTQSVGLPWWLASPPTAPTACLAPTTHTATTQVRHPLWTPLLLLLLLLRWGGVVLLWGPLELASRLCSLH
jgi:hypothetical protein